MLGTNVKKSLAIPPKLILHKAISAHWHTKTYMPPRDNGRGCRRLLLMEEKSTFGRPHKPIRRVFSDCNSTACSSLNGIPRGYSPYSTVWMIVRIITPRGGFVNPFDEKNARKFQKLCKKREMKKIRKNSKK